MYKVDTSVYFIHMSRCWFSYQEDVVVRIRCRIKGQQREMVFRLSVPYSVDKRNLKNFKIRIIIYGDMRGFNSLSAVGECAKSV